MNNKSCFSREPLRQAIDLGAFLYPRLLLCAAIWMLLPGLSPHVLAGDAPQWMHALTNAPLPNHDDKTDAVLLFSEEVLNVQPNGKMRGVVRRAYKILRPEGRGYGKVRLFFDSETKITSLHAWCIPAQGKDYEVKDKDTAEMGYLDVEGGELMTDVRTKVLQIPAADPGNIVGYEFEHEDRPYIFQDEWFFQEPVPVADARYTLQLPPGWEYKAVWINHPESPAFQEGSNRWQWRVNDIPAVKWEADMPPWKGVAGMMIVSVIPPGGTNRGFLNWSEMGLWYNGLTQGRRDPSSEIKQKAAALAGSSMAPLAKMRAIAEFIQKEIRYVAIELGIGGQQPHPASDVFTHRFGDCKDKATLMSTMLQIMGIDSYYVIIHTERGGVTPATPPHIGGFNHVILAIRLPDGITDSSLTATMHHPKLGKLLFFDPTDELTPFGQLRGALQANYGLLVAPDGGELTQLPQLPPALNGIIRKGDLALDMRGTLSGEVNEVLVGDAATHQRYAMRNIEKDTDRIKPIETLMSRSLGTFQITKATMSNFQETSLPFQFHWSFVASDYGKLAGNLLLVRPCVVGTKSSGLLETKDPRRFPFEFPGPIRDSDEFQIKLPPGYEVDDLPPPVNADYSFASYHSKTEASGNTLKFTRTFEVKELTVPVSKIEDLKKLYRIIAGDERNTAVLKPVGH